jgi:energy-coupling factor transporter ATP-binding protein EcfA2
MVNLIVGSRGSGKTKQMVEMINAAVKTSKGNIVCIEKGMKLTYDLDHHCRLTDMDEYGIAGYDRLYGFIAGILAGNYDIVELYVDGILKVLDRDLDALGRLLEALDKLGGGTVKFTVTVSAAPEMLPASVKKFQ